jgi:hypothetical protein
MNQILEALKLRTHPFRPLVDSTGEPFLDADVLLKPLDPQRDPRLINFYFDHYDWQGSIGHISKNSAFNNFPSRTDIQNHGPLITLITGSDNTGRESLRNLILYKIATQFGPPLTVRAALKSLNIADNIRTVATLFMYAYRRQEAQPTFQDLKAIFDEQAGEANVGVKDNYSTLFQIWREDVLPYCQRPLVLLVEDGDNHDLWRAIYDSTSELFQFIIVVTKNEPHANACYLGLSGKNRVLIKAQQLGQTRAHAYLEARLADERIGAGTAMGDVTPFSQEAFAVLYEHGTRFKPGDTIRWSIGWLNETFSAVLDDHLAKLSYRVEQLQLEGKDMTTLKQDELLIDAETVRATRQRLNQS